MQGIEVGITHLKQDQWRIHAILKSRRILFISKSDATDSVPVDEIQFLTDKRIIPGTVQSL